MHHEGHVLVCVRLGHRQQTGQTDDTESWAEYFGTIIRGWFPSLISDPAVA